MRNRDWDEPLIEDDPNHVLITSDGRVFGEVNEILSEEQYRRRWNGWECICGEPWETQWPEKCPMGCFWSDVSVESQRAWLEQHGGGEESWVGMSQATYDRMANDADRAGWKKKTGIWLPGDK